MKHQPTLLISNACSELGQALVSDAAEHFRVALADADGQLGNQLCANLHGNGREALFLDCLPGSSRDRQRGVERVLRRWQQLDTVINLPAPLTLGPFEATQTSHWQRVMDEQLMDTVNLCQSAISAMHRQEEGGRILNVVPEYGILAGPLAGAQSAASAAIVALGESLHSELHSSGIRVTTLVIPLYQEQASSLCATDPLSDARFQRKIARSPVTREELSQQILDALNSGNALHIASGYTRAKWRRKRWFRKRWERGLRELGARYRR
ncbi:short chain dehydrogenase/reductase family oxidoreductase [Alcanivorax jadensis T9]|uniref:Short chain dehydrogenase/reductase family oxidoreductase n=1 Tax=Alcanivorax jadensis T9 TaxID=1177181 RepID=A0ABR4WGK4_9GAMM|nr:SDR family NAD(P)-dependent oxidoreductase [Alcanivorax jadensis]KGD62731.1 short chain dehydrogenase/reductase family oxidoreductase [Alcanivorax jadensis T9]MBP22504.1 SDR family oxidoreductase [Alcanivorax sp.]MDF1637889.1 SDR family NAD(P)-dependent oxidoreductase [Alcanivorax jadensis]